MGVGTRAAVGAAVKTLFPFFLLGALGLAGCGAAEDVVDEASDSHTVALRGYWRAADGQDRPATFSLTQRALTATVVVELEGHECLARSQIDAKYDPLDGFEARAQVGGMTLNLSGEPGIEEIVGNFDALADGPCKGKGGTLALFRR